MHADPPESFHTSDQHTLLMRHTKGLSVCVINGDQAMMDEEISAGLKLRTKKIVTMLHFLHGSVGFRKATFQSHPQRTDVTGTVDYNTYPILFKFGVSKIMAMTGHMKTVSSALYAHGWQKMM